MKNVTSSLDQIHLIFIYYHTEYQIILENLSLFFLLYHHMHHDILCELISIFYLLPVLNGSRLIRSQSEFTVTSVSALLSNRAKCETKIKSDISEASDQCRIQYYFWRVHMRMKVGEEREDHRSDHVCLTGVFLWMASLFLPRYCLEWIVEAVALRTAASDKHCVNTMCVTWGLSVCAQMCVSVF